MEKKKMTVAEMIAAARKTDGGNSGASAESAAPAAEPVDAAPKPAAKPAAAKPAAAAAKPAAGGARPSVAEMMAMARAEKEKSAGAAPAEKAAAKPAAAAAKKESPKPAAKTKEPELVASTGPKDTASILSAARKETQPGPMSKAQAAAKAPASKPAAPRRPVPPMPAKPDYAKPKPAPVVEENRRTVMFNVLLGSALAIGFTTMTATFSLWTLGFARFMFPNILTEPPSKFKVGFPGNFAPGQVDTRFVAQFGVWVVNYEYAGKGQIFALRTVCTHLGCTPNWLEGEQKFKCPCHGSGFYKDGINFEGPAPRPLERYAIRIADDGQLEIDKSRMFLEEKGDWSDPFVPV
jgi:cytochrome b6-f complex iron-sulfur subunit